MKRKNAKKPRNRASRELIASVKKRTAPVAAKDEFGAKLARLKGTVLKDIDLEF
jgi:hypothetical protein